MVDWTKLFLEVGVAPGKAAQWAPHFAAFPFAFSTGPKELPHFLSQILHESARLKALEEDLNYSSNGMMKTWPSRFPALDSTKPYVFNPEALANKVYGGRLGNTLPGSGWKFRGSGFIQVTGYDNFLFLEKLTKLPLTKNPELLRTAGPTAILAAYLWWEGKVPDGVMGDLRAVRKAVNGGTIGLDDTTFLYKTLCLKLPS